ncbi:MAG: gfo/Idh/MocA family oxidoreductase [Armatimonadia bacterium]|nr:gfo/Idh/MocA family oxidoreductase [Armatimonadia bacterium]
MKRKRRSIGTNEAVLTQWRQYRRGGGRIKRRRVVAAGCRSALLALQSLSRPLLKHDWSLALAPKRYALVGTGHRALGMFAKPLCNDFPDTAELVGLCDANPLRVDAVAAMLPKPVPTFTDFDAMLAATEPDAVAVATKDCSHTDYVIAALRAGRRVICEKPLCTTADQCRAILDTEARSDGECRVTHNARYGATDTAIRDIIQSGRLDRVLTMHFHETLDRCHGADYFRRWHRVRANSGGLLIHKACHHFDCLNWWADSEPVWVSAQGSRQFYGDRGPFCGPRCSDCPHVDDCDFYTDLFQKDVYRRLYRECESADGYFRDGCVFDPEIDIEDQMGVLIRYANGVEVSYTLVAYSPYESQRVFIEFERGRLEYTIRYNTGFASGSQRVPGIEELMTESVKLYVPGEGVEDVPLERTEGGHGGADPQLRADHFGRDWDAEPTERMASLKEAVNAVLIGAAANRSIATGEPVEVQKLLRKRGRGSFSEPVSP